MAKPLLVRAGPDTLAKLERAAAQRYSDAGVLRDRRPLAALYMYGYSVEMRLKAAYYHTIGLSPHTDFDVPGLGGRSPRKVAEVEIARLADAGEPIPVRTMTGRYVSAGHNVVGWARRLEVTRAAPGHVPLDPALVIQMNRYAEDVFDNWSEILRYRTNRPTVGELALLRHAARWFGRHARDLWR